MKSIMFATLSATLLLGSIPAYADDDVETSSTQTSATTATKTLRITKYAPGVNLPCPKGSDKMFVLRVFVHKNSLGTFAEGNRGVGEIVLRNDRQLNSEDYLVPYDYREADFFFYAPHRAAKIKKDPSENSVTLELAGPNMWFRMSPLRSDCQERYGM